MKPNFALDLSHEGIILRHRAAGGRWTEVGDVPLDDPALRENLSYLRSTALGLEGKGFATKLILPNSQILYREIHAPGPGKAEREAQIKAALKGATAYDLADLTFDWISRGAYVLVAAVANETLDEAESFAVEHRFNPISLVGRESGAPDAWEPYFGRTDYSFAFLGPEADVRDTPPPEEPPEDRESLFVEAPDTPVSTADTNMFAPAPEANGEKNIFSPDLAPPEAAQPATPPDDGQDGNLAGETARAPAFSSRRHGGEHLSDPAPETRPLTRVEARIALSTDQPAPQEPPQTRPEPDSPAEDHATINTAPNTDTGGGQPLGANLRADILGQDEERPSIGARLRVFALALGVRFGSGLSGGVGKASTLGLGAVKRAGTAAKTIKARRKQEKPAPATRSEPAVTKPAPEGDPATDDAANADQVAERRKIVVRATVAAIALVIFGGAYTFFTGGPPSGNSPLPTGKVSLTTAATRGVRGDNRPRARPSDLASGVVTRTAPIKPIRPARRSIFEGRTDPQANLPDTAQPLTSLSEQEIADIRAAGLSTPTVEEMAEGANAGPAAKQSDAKIAAAYAATGALQSVRAPPPQPANPQREDIYVATVDRPLGANDAIILPDFNAGVQDDPPARVASPLGRDVTFSLDANGLVTATPEGALTPDGVLVRLGKPPVTPPVKPVVAQLVPPDPLAALKPKPRPTTLITGADAIYVQGKLTITQLRAFRAKPRPVSIQQSAGGTGATTPSEMAVLTSFKPSRRPSDFSKIVKKTRVQMAAVSARAPRVKGYNFSANIGTNRPTRASVAKRATIRGAINLSRLNLIGVYGTPARRSALLRLPNGRFVKVKIGDRVEGGQIAAINTSSLSYVKSGRNRVLKIPN